MSDGLISVLKMTCYFRLDSKHRPVLMWVSHVRALFVDMGFFVFSSDYRCRWVSHMRTLQVCSATPHYLYFQVNVFRSPLSASACPRAKLRSGSAELRYDLNVWHTRRALISRQIAATHQSYPSPYKMIRPLSPSSVHITARCNTMTLHGAAIAPHAA